MNYYNQNNNNSKIEILQHNTARSIPIMHTCLEIANKSNIDFVLIQEPWIADNNISTVSHSAFTAILPNSQNIRPRVIIYARKATIYNYCARPDLINDPDIQILDISGPGVNFQLINLYNKKSLKPNKEEWTIT
jgi:hypothetical protein